MKSGVILNFYFLQQMINNGVGLKHIPIQVHEERYFCGHRILKTTEYQAINSILISRSGMLPAKDKMNTSS